MPVCGMGLSAWDLQRNSTSAAGSPFCLHGQKIRTFNAFLRPKGRVRERERKGERNGGGRVVRCETDQQLHKKACVCMCVCCSTDF